MLSKLKRAFGFGSHDEDDLIADDPDLQSPDTSPFAASQQAAIQVSTTDFDATAQRIFDHAVAQFNKALPEFLRNSVDAERQKALLFDSMSQDLRNHLTALEKEVTDRLDQAWRAEREKLQSDLRTLSDTAKDIEAKRTELKQQQLSSDRQRRALTERVRDLEKQILTLEAEKEQLDLETKSMLNKVKVAQVYEKDCEALREQVVFLQSELNKMRVGNDSESGEVHFLSPTEYDSLKQAADRAEALETEVASLKDSLKSLQEEKESLDTRIDDNDNTAELERLRGIAKEYDTLTEQMAQIEAKMNEVDQVTLSKDKKIAKLSSELAQVKSQLDDTNNTLERTRLERDQAVEQARHAPTDNTGQRPGRRRKALPDDDDILNDTDWIVNRPQRAKSTEARNERSRSKKQNYQDDGQMSLW